MKLCLVNASTAARTAINISRGARARAREGPKVFYPRAIRVARRRARRCGIAVCYASAHRPSPRLYYIFIFAECTVRVWIPRPRVTALA